MQGAEATRAIHTANVDGDIAQIIAIAARIHLDATIADVRAAIGDGQEGDIGGVNC